MGQHFSPFVQHESTQDKTDGHVKKGAMVGGHPASRLTIVASQAPDPGTPHELRINVQVVGDDPDADPPVAGTEVGSVLEFTSTDPVVVDVRHLPARWREQFTFRNYSVKAGKDATTFTTLIEV